VAAKEGWYADPADEQRVRFWNGTGWTEETRRRADLDVGSAPATGEESTAYGVVEDQEPNYFVPDLADIREVADEKPGPVGGGADGAVDSGVRYGFDGNDASSYEAALEASAAAAAPTTPTTPSAASAPPFGLVPAGMYLDPEGSGRQRYWDGGNWWPLSSSATWTPQQPGGGGTLRGRPHLTPWAVFWYVFQCASWGGGYLAKMPLKKALEEAGMVTRTSAEQVWYVLECIFFGWGYLAKVPAKKALEEAGWAERTTAEQVWYVLECVYFGAGYFYKVPIKKALEEDGLVTRSSGERFWYVVQCILFGWGYLSKAVAAKALSEADWEDRQGLPVKRWWYWVIAFAVVLTDWFVIAPLERSQLENAFPQIAAAISYSEASTTLNSDLQREVPMEQSTNVATKAQGFNDESASLAQFKSSVAAIKMPASDSADKQRLLSAVGSLVVDMHQEAQDAADPAAASQISQRVLDDATTFSSTQEALLEDLG
jgi:hypothetical protein